jgi:putative transposase
LKGRRHTPEQIVRKLQEADRLVAEGKSMAVVLKQLGVSEQTYYRWRKAYGSLSPDEARRLRELESENRRLKKLVADTPVPGLYHASSPTHGGGGVTGILGFQAVRQLLHDRKRRDRRGSRGLRPRYAGP